MGECLECTACCSLFPVDEINKPFNTACVYCDKGCTIYQNRPKECSSFDCSYLQMKVKNIELRPDKCGIIFEKLSDDIFFGTVVPEMAMSEMAKKQVFSFVEQGFSVVLSSISKSSNKFFISKRHNEEAIKKQFNEYLIKHGLRY